MTGKLNNSIISLLLTGVLGALFVLLVKLEILKGDNKTHDEALDYFSKVANSVVSFAVSACALTNKILVYSMSPSGTSHIAPAPANSNAPAVVSAADEFDIPLFIIIYLALFLLLITRIRQYFKAHAKNICITFCC